MHRHKGFFVLVLCLALLLTGCNGLSGNVNDLLRAPALSEDPGAIQRALAAALGGEPNYKYPKEGQNHSPLLIADLDGDGSEEGIVFYSPPEATGNQVNVAVLNKSGGEWELVYEVQGVGTEVASVDLADMYGDGSLQLVVGYSVSAASKSLVVYEYNGQGLESWNHGPYNSYLLDDFTGHGAKEIAVVSKGEANLHLNIITARDGQIKYQQEDPVALVTELGNCIGVYTSIGDNQQRYLVVDAIIEQSGFLASQILAFSESGERIYVRENDYTAQVTAVTATMRNSTLLTSRDLDGDGVIEIPVLSDNGGEIDEDLAQFFYYLEWVDFTKEEPETKYFGLFDTVGGLFIRLPLAWQGEIRLMPTETGWRLRPAESSRVLLEYVAQTGELQELPQGAAELPGTGGGYLLPASSLTISESLAIEVLQLA